MSGGSDAQRVDFGPATQGFQNLANDFNNYMREAYDWAKGQWKKQEPYSDEVQGILMEQAKLGRDWAVADRQRYEQVFKPIEDQYIREVQAYDTPGRRAQEAGRAAGAASQMAEANADEAKRQLSTFGVKPTDLRMGALDLGARMTKASMAAAAAEKARMDVEGRGLALRQGVVNLGGQYPGRAIANYGMSQAGGQGGVNVGLQTDQTYGNLMGTAPQWGGLNVNALSGLTGALDAQQKANLAVAEANQSGSGGFGKLAGTLIGGAAGAYFGGPMGASAGASIGGSLGGMANFARGGVVDVTDDMGGYVDPRMSPSGGAATDDVRAVIPGANGQPQQPARINAGEFIFTRPATEFYGSKYLQGLVDKAHVSMGLQAPKPAGRGKEKGPAQGQANAGGVIPMQAGGMVPDSYSYLGGDYGWVGAAPGSYNAAGLTQGDVGPTFAPPERSWKDVGRDFLGGMAAAGGGGGGGGGGGEQQRSPLDVYSRYGLLPMPQVNDPGGAYADGGVIDTRPFDPEGAEYDDETARRLNIEPDETGHRPTYGPGGVMLKGARHPTRHKSITEDERLGYESYKAQDGRYYVRSKGGYGYQQGGVVEDIDQMPPTAEHDAIRRHMHKLGRARTENQVRFGEWQRDREDAWMRLDLDRRGWKVPGYDYDIEHEWAERGESDRAQQKVDEWRRNYRPPPGGVPGYADGGEVPQQGFRGEAMMDRPRRLPPYEAYPRSPPLPEYGPPSPPPSPRYIGRSELYERPFNRERFQREAEDVRNTSPRYPDRGDLAHARQVQAEYGDPYQSYGQRGASLPTLTRENLPPDTRGIHERFPPLPVSDDIADDVYRAGMATRRSALAGLGWRPDIINVLPRTLGLRYGDRRGSYKSSKAGGYTPRVHDEETIYWDQKAESAPVHESMHRGIQKLVDANKLSRHPVDKNYISTNEEEALMQLLMEKNYGGVEGFGDRSFTEKRWPRTKRVLDLAKQVEALAAEEVRRERPYGGPR